MGKGNKTTFIDMAGLRIARWSVLEPVGKTRYGAYLWLCVCDCGQTKTVPGPRLRAGASLGCKNCRPRQQGRFLKGEKMLIPSFRKAKKIKRVEEKKDLDLLPAGRI